MSDKCKINLEWIPAAYKSFATTEHEATVKSADDICIFPLYNGFKEKGIKHSRVYKPDR
ncbi:MAG: hypothetical protein JWR38_3670 [Mucilaginibacter sp.]|nr:hypothetical protein [Mucilaginibacter sp.]